MKKIYYREDYMKDSSANRCWVIPVLDNKPTGREIMEYVESMIKVHGQVCPYTRRPISSKDDLAELMDYFNLEFKDQPARRIVVSKQDEKA